MVFPAARNDSLLSLSTIRLKGVNIIVRRILGLLIYCGIFSLGVYCQTKTDIPKPIDMPDPVYPAVAAELKLGGSIGVQVRVDTSGNVKPINSFGPSIPCGQDWDERFEPVRKAAMDAAKKAKFEIPIKDGKPADIELILNYRFDKNGKPVASGDRSGPLDIGDANGRATSLPRPAYPRINGVKPAGMVTVSVLISEKGDVIAAGVVSGPRLLHQVTVTAVCSAKFSPTLQNGVPIETIGVVKYNFVNPGR